MTVKTDHLGTGAFLKSEANGSLSRETLTIASGAGVLLAGTVVGKVTTGGKYKAYDNDASDGTEVAAAVILNDVDATSADVKVVGFVRLAEVYSDRLVWGAAVTTDAEKAAALADLAAKFVIAR
jgi:hypothetical protein